MRLRLLASRAAVADEVADACFYSLALLEACRGMLKPARPKRPIRRKLMAQSALLKARMVAIIASGIANVRSVSNAFAAVGVDAAITSDPAVIRAADKLVLPGVGAFADGMKNLRERGLVDLLNVEVMERKKPILGICLGMQLFTEVGMEHGEHRGLGWIAGNTSPFEFADAALCVPHVGWNDCAILRREPLFSGFPERPDFYFVHSFHVQAESRDVVAATCDYGGEFVAAISSGNIMGVQFHPEKSHQAGLAVLKNFALWKLGC